MGLNMSPEVFQALGTSKHSGLDTNQDATVLAEVQIQELGTPKERSRARRLLANITTWAMSVPSGSNTSARIRPEGANALLVYLESGR